MLTHLSLSTNDQMRYLLFFPAISLFFLASGQTSVIYVKPGAKGDGQSWKTAMPSLQNALKKAKPGDQIWVAEGLYLPTDGRNRKATFEVPDQVELYGGFAGTERTIAERDPMKHPTILSGNIGSNDPKDNVYNVVCMTGVSSQTRLDGFLVIGGRADDFEKPAGSRERSGGGLFNNGGKKASRPTVFGCVFLDNFALDGGAVYNAGQNLGDAGGHFDQCTFRDNSAELDGGGVYNDARLGGTSAPVFSDCTFKNNRANYGGAFFSFCSVQQEPPTLVRCTFLNNSASIKGGAVFSIGKAPETNFPDVQFKDNHAGKSESRDAGSITLSD